MACQVSKFSGTYIYIYLYVCVFYMIVYFHTSYYNRWSHTSINQTIVLSLHQTTAHELELPDAIYQASRMDVTWYLHCSSSESTKYMYYQVDHLHYGSRRVRDKECRASETRLLNVFCQPTSSVTCQSVCWVCVARVVLLMVFCWSTKVFRSTVIILWSSLHSAWIRCACKFVVQINVVILD